MIISTTAMAGSVTENGGRTDSQGVSSAVHHKALIATAANKS